MKKFIIASLILSSTVANAYSGPVYLNIPEHYSPTTGEFVPTMSLPTSNRDVCSDAIVEYAKENLVYYIGCDVNPLPGAVNLQPRRR